MSYVILTELERQARRSLWIEQARSLREQQPAIWEAYGAELVGLAEATIGDVPVDEPPMRPERITG